MDCLLSHPGAVTDVMLLPTTCVACLLIIMQQTCSMEQMPSKQHLEHVPGAAAQAVVHPPALCSQQLVHVLQCAHPGRCILLPCTVQSRCCLLVSQHLFHVLPCAHPGRCILLPGTVQSRCCLLVSQQNTWWSLLSRVPCSRLWCLQAGNLCLHQCWLASLKLPCVAAGLQLDALVDVQAKVLSVLHHDTAAISAVRCLKLFLERLGCAFGEGDEAEVRTAWPLSASGSYLWHTVGGGWPMPSPLLGPFTLR